MNQEQPKQIPTVRVMVRAATANRVSAKQMRVMPVDLRAHIEELEIWAEANGKKARQDARAFWILKLPAIVASASASVWAFYHFPVITVLVGAIASLCMIVDGMNPRGMLRKIHF